MLSRQLEPIIINDLKKKMVFIAGPRQCGKTTLAKAITKKVKIPWSYYNWDIDEQRLDLLKNRLDVHSRLWIFDELHKYSMFPNYLY